MNNNFHEIIENLYVGNSKSSESQDFNVIINCTKEYEIPFPINSKALCIRISIKDDPYDSNILLSKINEYNLLEKICSNIKNKLSVLVHCSMGIQRSCTVVACYLIKYYKMTPDEAIKYIKSKRPIAFFGNVNLLSTIVDFYNMNIYY
jgi:protein-tyrosine phosphatase